MVSGKDVHGGIRVRTLLRGIPVVSSSFCRKGLEDVAVALRFRRLSVAVSGEENGAQ
jgi:hypothetical protein